MKDQGRQLNKYSKLNDYQKSMIIEGKQAGLVSSAFSLWKILIENIIDSSSKKVFTFDLYEMANGDY